MRQGYKAPCIVAPCGSGKSVIIAEIIKLTAENKKHTLFLVHRKELKEQIEETLEWWGVDLNYVKIGMVQTVVRRLNEIKAPDLIVTDENHHSLASSYKKIYEYFENAILVGFTATPVRLNGGGLGDVNDILIEGPSVRWLIDNNYLADYKYYAPYSIDVSKLAIKRGEFDVKNMDIGKKIYGDVVKHYKKLANDEKAICYCATIKHSKEIAQEFRIRGVPASHIDGTTPKTERDEIINNFRSGKIKVLSNVDIVGEGFNVPDCSTVILVRPTRSLSLYIQQSMRGMRYREGKTSIIIDHVQNYKIHGLPDTPRKWSLVSKKDSEIDLDNAVRQCLECFYTAKLADWRANNNECPACGKPFHQEIEDVEKSRIAHDKEAELHEVDKEKFNQAFVINTKTPEDCQNMKELYELAKERGYKPGWAYYQGKRLNLI